MMRFYLFLCLFCIITSAAYADVDALTNENITQFIEHTTAFTTDQNNRPDDRKITTYLNDHIEDKARFVSTMRYHIPDMPMQKANMSLSKDEYIQSVIKGPVGVSGYNNLIEIKSIKIATNKRKAFVKTVTTEYGFMNVPSEKSIPEEMPMEGVSECTQVLSLNKGFIQMFSATCVTNVEIKGN